MSDLKKNSVDVDPRHSKIPPPHQLALALALIFIGVCCLIAGTLFLLGIGAGLHPLLASDEGRHSVGIVLLVSGIALAGSGAFPLALAWLTAQDKPAEETAKPTTD